MQVILLHIAGLQLLLALQTTPNVPQELADTIRTIANQAINYEEPKVINQTSQIGALVPTNMITATVDSKFIRFYRNDEPLAEDVIVELYAPDGSKLTTQKIPAVSSDKWEIPEPLSLKGEYTFLYTVGGVERKLFFTR